MNWCRCSMLCHLLFLLYLDSFLGVGDSNPEMITVRPVFYPTPTTTPPATPAPPTAANAHKVDNGVGEVTGEKSSPKKFKCGIKMHRGCRCSKHEGSFSITCYKAHLCMIPNLDFGPILVRSLNLEYNNLTKVKIGDFFGLKIENLYLGWNCLRSLEFLAFWGLEYHLETLDISYNLFAETPASALRLLRHVKTLKLSGNKITRLRDNDFSGLHKLQMLFVDNNPIWYIETAAFHDCTPFLLNLNKIDLQGGLMNIPTGDFGQLQRLRLAENEIESIPFGWFQNLTSLRFLDLENNILDNLDADAFNGAGASLKKLNLRNNKLRRVPRNTLKELPKLEMLDLASNKIRKIRGFTFNSSQQLQELDLRHNGIVDLHKNALVGLDNIRKIDLRHNEMLVVDDRTFYWEDLSGRQVYLSDNPWLCNCLMKWMKREHRKRTALSKIFSDIMSVRCQRPTELENAPIVRVALSKFTCDHGYYFYEYDHY